MAKTGKTIHLEDETWDAMKPYAGVTDEGTGRPVGLSGVCRKAVEIWLDWKERVATAEDKEDRKS